MTVLTVLLELNHAIRLWPRHHYQWLDYGIFSLYTKSPTRNSWVHKTLIFFSRVQQRKNNHRNESNKTVIKLDSYCIKYPSVTSIVSVFISTTKFDYDTFLLQDL